MYSFCSVIYGRVQIRIVFRIYKVILILCLIRTVCISDHTVTVTVTTKTTPWQQAFSIFFNFFFRLLFSGRGQTLNRCKISDFRGHLFNQERLGEEFGQSSKHCQHLPKYSTVARCHMQTLEHSRSNYICKYILYKLKYGIFLHFLSHKFNILEKKKT